VDDFSVRKGLLKTLGEGAEIGQWVCDTCAPNVADSLQREGGRLAGVQTDEGGPLLVGEEGDGPGPAVVHQEGPQGAAPTPRWESSGSRSMGRAIEARGWGTKQHVRKWGPVLGTKGGPTALEPTSVRINIK